MGQRYESRKDKRKNQILNIAITIVVILILFFGGTLVVNMVNQDETATEESRQIIDLIRMNRMVQMMMGLQKTKQMKKMLQMKKTV